MAELLTDLRDFGFPITKDSVDKVVDYLEYVDKQPDEVNHRIVAQSIDQNHEDINFETNNEVSTRKMLEHEGIDTSEMSCQGVKMTYEYYFGDENSW